MATARALTLALGPLDLDELRPWHPEIALALAELARSAGRDWPWGYSDPLVALLRALAKLSLDAPGASSRAAARLVAAFDATAKPHDQLEPDLATGCQPDERRASTAPPVDDSAVLREVA